MELQPYTSRLRVRAPVKACTQVWVWSLVGARKRGNRSIFLSQVEASFSRPSFLSLNSVNTSSSEDLKQGVTFHSTFPKCTFLHNTFYKNDWICHREKTQTTTKRAAGEPPVAWERDRGDREAGRCPELGRELEELHRRRLTLPNREYIHYQGGNFNFLSFSNSPL